ncbi:MAG: hypothetical protein WDN49_22240 [Acetobacteraceae bacterium]
MIYEEDNGSSKWANVTFEDVISYKYDEWTCMNAEIFPDPKKHSRRRRFGMADRNTSKMDRSVGKSEHQKKLGGTDRFRHYLMDFDDAGMLQVIASKCTVGSPG